MIYRKHNMPLCPTAGTVALLTILLTTLLYASPSFAECSDGKAKVAANELSIAFLGKKSELFQPAVVLKRHHPSKQKEVASYVKAGSQYYTMFSIVNAQCQAAFIKRAGPRY